MKRGNVRTSHRGWYHARWIALNAAWVIGSAYALVHYVILPYYGFDSNSARVVERTTVEVITTNGPSQARPRARTRIPQQRVSAQPQRVIDSAAASRQQRIVDDLESGKARCIGGHVVYVEKRNGVVVASDEAGAKCR